MMPSADLEAYRKRVMKAFPPQAFYGLISTHDEYDDGIRLRNELRGKRWDQLSRQALFHGSIGLPLLEPDAWVAYLPAWLVRSMETFGEDSKILECTLYFLCPGSHDEGWNERRIAGQPDSSTPLRGMWLGNSCSRS